MALRTHCIRGHEFTAENTGQLRSKPGQRRCKACGRILHARARRLATSEKREAELRYSREWKKENRGRQLAAKYRYIKKFPEKRMAQDTVGRAVRQGKLARPDQCSLCGTSCKPEAHHHDYSKRLDVTWLCRPCHLEVERLKKPGNSRA